ncbi:MAG: hypothetical protein Q8T09_18310 [Candidatus Melainabacteria bacterium]|nr:hypothetical protein [Candidatus Melainabacteria bacterium]
MRDIVRLFCALGLSLLVSGSAFSVEAQVKVKPAAVSVDEMIRWMPADTESIAVTQAPVRLSARHDWAGVGPETVLDRLADASALLPDYDWSKGVKLARVVSGSRRFSLPKNLGPFLFEGCSILEFASDSRLTAEQFLKGISVCSGKTVTLCGKEVVEVVRAIDEDSWRFYACALSPNVVLWATDAKFLTSVLQRSASKSPRVAFTEAFPLWRWIDREADFWGLRDYSKIVELHRYMNSPSSLIEPDASLYRDKKPVGYAVYYKTEDSKFIKTFVSKDKKAQAIREHWQRQSAEKCHVTCWERQPAPNVLQFAEDVTEGDDEHKFVLPLVVVSDLGHAAF